MGDTATAFVQLRIHGRLYPPSGPVKIRVPKGRVYPSDMVPAAGELADIVVSAAVDQVTAQGKKISCRAGCGACCRQLVPLAEPEVYHLRGVVEQMAAERRAEIMRRFSEAQEQLQAAGMLDRLLQSREMGSRERHELGLRYFQLGIACPFLENESCSIYSVRPVECREYLVTSPPEHCGNPSKETVDCVRLEARVSQIIGRLADADRAAGPRWVPLILAMRRSASDEVPQRPRLGHVMLEQLVRGVAGAGK